MPKNLWDKCTFVFEYLEKDGVLRIRMYYKKKRIATLNHCGGISSDNKFIVTYNEVYKRK